jgi:EAL domain-containing protein (putative c-di-GMP-specific phosphodiesterase class I)/GGDEF domain-containing protein
LRTLPAPPSAAGFLDAMEFPTCVLDGEGCIAAVNLAWRDFVVVNGGDPSQAAVGSNYFEVCEQAAGDDPTAAAEVSRELRRLLAGHLLRFEFEYASRRPVAERWFSVRAPPLTESPGVILTHLDVSAAKRIELARASQIVRDSVAFVSDRQALTRRLSSLLASAHGGHVGVAFVHVDSLQRVIDDLESSGAEEMLSLVSHRLAPDSADLVFRFATEDFVVIWPALQSAAQATRRADVLSAAFRTPFVLEAAQASVWLTAQAGHALATSSDRVDDLLVAAETAMRSGERGSRSCTRVYTEEAGAPGLSIALAEAELQEAIARQEFVLHYQPVVDLQRGAVTGVEALARWPRRGRLGMPDDFVPLAESTGLIVPLGQWVVEEACRQGAQWALAGVDLDVAVNLSVRQISHSEVPATIERALARSGLDPGRLLIEVTESAVMEDADAAQRTLWQIAQLGVGIGIDDFGTGYSSLLYLKRYPVNALKVDKSFVAGLGVHSDDDGIVASIVGLGRAVGAACIAEGVETTEQLAALTELGYAFAQGFLLGQPVVAAEVPEAVARCHRLLDAQRGERLVRRAPSLASARGKG